MRKYGISFDPQRALIDYRTAVGSWQRRDREAAGLGFRIVQRRPGSCSCCGPASDGRCFPSRWRAGLGSPVGADFETGSRRASGTSCTGRCSIGYEQLPGSIGPGPAWTALPSPPKGDDKTGSKPIDRGSLGTKRHLITARKGLPLAFVLTDANDGVPFEELLDSIPPVGGQHGRAQHRPDKLQVDKAYDH